MRGGFELAEIWGGAGATWRALGMREGGCEGLDVMAFAVAPIGRGGRGNSFESRTYGLVR